MIELGFFLDGEYYERIDGERGHREVAERIIRNRYGWADQFQSLKERERVIDPVDFLINFRGAVKIGNRWGAKVVTYNSLKMNGEVYDVIKQYQMRGYRVEDTFNL